MIFTKASWGESEHQGKRLESQEPPSAEIPMPSQGQGGPAPPACARNPYQRAGEVGVGLVPGGAAVAVLADVQMVHKPVAVEETLPWGGRQQHCYQTRGPSPLPSPSEPPTHHVLQERAKPSMSEPSRSQSESKARSGITLQQGPAMARPSGWRACGPTMGSGTLQERFGVSSTAPARCSAIAGSQHGSPPCSPCGQRTGHRDAGSKQGSRDPRRP